ncbi:MAG: DUF4115 domain-containing protein [Dehalococcoidia bacterium]|nr:DUF4115 domain-containing protein [Dehalococcoidia bacterium]
MQLDAEAWPIALLVLRVVAVALLYLFLFTAFRALRNELRAPAVPERRPMATPSAVRARPAAVPPVAVTTPASEAAWDEEPLPDETWDDEEEWDEGDYGWETEPAASAYVQPLPAPARRRPPARLWVPIAAAVLVVTFGGTALLLAGSGPGTPPAGDVPAGEATVDVSQPPTVAPAAGRVTVGLAATEDAQVRVTVDGTVQFDGTLRKGERQNWEGGERIQVWTDSGKTLQLAVNGVDLGAYSPAMGHPDWNRIDFGFWPGWAQ